MTTTTDIETLRTALAEIRMAAVTTPGSGPTLHLEILEGIHRLASAALDATDGNACDNTEWHLWHRLADIDEIAQAGMRFGLDAALASAIRLIGRMVEGALS